MTAARAPARRRLVLAALAGLVVGPVAAQALQPSEQRLQQLMQARRGQLTPEAARERLALLARGEALMAAGDLDAAQAAFDSAALMLHAADTEIALVRCYMQRGEYQRAISFGAHAAGAHRDVSAGAVLYAWLLQVGGQGAFAARLLDEARQLRPDDALLAEAQEALRQPALSPGLLPGAAAVRLGPLPLGDTTLPASARVLCTATLAGAQGQALAPLSAVREGVGGAGLWLRDGLGRTAAAQVHQRWPELGLALLAAPDWHDRQAPAWALRDAFPGSPAHALAHGASGLAVPAWPQLAVGFLGGVRPDGSQALGIALPPGPHGGPVMNGLGQLLGVALAHPDGVARLVPVSLLTGRLNLPSPAAPAAPAIAAPRLPMAAVYESALGLSLQLIAA